MASEHDMSRARRCTKGQLKLAPALKAAPSIIIPSLRQPSLKKVEDGECTVKREGD